MNYIVVLIFLILVVGWKTHHNTRFVRSREADLLITEETYSPWLLMRSEALNLKPATSQLSSINSKLRTGPQYSSRVMRICPRCSNAGGAVQIWMH